MSWRKHTRNWLRAYRNIRNKRKWDIRFSPVATTRCGFRLLQRPLFRQETGATSAACWTSRANHGAPELVKKCPGSLGALEAELPLNTEGADAILRVGNQPQCPEPNR